MKNLFLCVLLIFCIQSVPAVTNTKKPEILHVKLNISDISNVDGKISEEEINNSCVISNNKWIPLGDSYGDAVFENKSNSGAIHEQNVNLVLSKLISLNDKNATIQFMLIDLNSQKGNFIIDPKITVPYAQEATMIIKKESHHIKIRVLASKNNDLSNQHKKEAIF